MKSYTGKRLEEGCEVYVTLDDGKSYPLPQHLEIRNHSPGYLVPYSLVMLDVTIGAEQFESFRVACNLSSGETFVRFPVPLLLLGRIGMVKMESCETPIVAAALATSPELMFEPDESGLFFATPSSLLALRARVLPPLVTFVRERFPTFVAEPWALEVNTRALVFALEWQHAPTPSAAPLVKTVQTIVTAPVRTVRDSDPATKTIERRIRAHIDSTTGYYLAEGYQVESLNNGTFEWGYGGSGPSQLALAICADYFGQDPIPEECPFCGTKMKDSWKCPERYSCGYDGEKEGDCWRSITGGLVHYMTFKRDFLAKLGPTWVITAEEIDTWAALQRVPNFPA